MAIRCVIVCLIGLTAVGHTVVAARELVVAPTGDDQAAGTKAAPLRTIGKGVALARAGDTILVRDGVYAEGVRFAESGARDMPITLKNFPDERPVIQPGEPQKRPPAQGILLQARAGHEKAIGWIVIEGLEIRYAYDGIKFYNSHDVVFRNCRIQESWNQGMLGNGNRVWIDRNLIAKNGTNPEARDNQLHGIYAGGSDFKITSNVIHSNRSYGIQVAAYPFKADAHAGKEFSGAKNWLISNNTLARNRHGGIVIWMADAENCIVQNNIFYRNIGVNGVLFYNQGGKRHPIRNNIFFSSVEQPYPALTSTEEADFDARDNQEVDPQFADPESYRLGKDSSAIDRGHSESAPSTDFFGNHRPQKGGIDIGAHEFHPTD